MKNKIGAKMGPAATTEIEKQSLEVHVDLCAIRYQQLDHRLTKVEQKIDSLHEDIIEGNASLIKVVVGAAGTICAGLLSTIVVLLMKG